MLNRDDFTLGEDESQFFYEFKNEITGEIICILNNKGENKWKGFFIVGESVRLIPVDFNENIDEFINEVCNWYNLGAIFMERDECLEVSVKTYGKTLENLKKNNPALSNNTILKIQSYLDNPSEDRWSDICNIAINSKYTLWQAVLNMDNSFPKTGRSYNVKGELVKEWETIPSPYLLLKSIKEIIK